MDANPFQQGEGRGEKKESLRASSLGFSSSRSPVWLLQVGDAEEQGKAPGLGCLQEWGWSLGCAGAVAQLQFIPCISQERLNPVLWPQINSSPLVRVLLQSLGKTPLIPAASGARLLPVLGTSPASCS